MALTLDKFEDIRFESVFDIKASEYKNPNIHRAIFKINRNGDEFTTEDFEKLREEICLNIKIYVIINKLNFDIFTRMEFLYDDFQYVY